MTATDLGTTTIVTGTYNLDPSHSRVGFVARHAMVTKVRGSFNDVSATAALDAEQPERSSVEVRIKTASIDTRNEDRDNHLRTNDFLDAATYPEIRFASTAVALVAPGTFAVTGDLVIKGVAKPVTIEFAHTGTVVDPWGNTRVGFEGSTTINRREWGVNWNAALEAGGVLVSEKITLEFEISAVKAA